MGHASEAGTRSAQTRPSRPAGALTTLRAWIQPADPGINPAMTAVLMLGPLLAAKLLGAAGAIFGVAALIWRAR